MRKLAALFAIIGSLVLAGVAGAVPPSMVDGDGGGIPAPGVYIFSSITYDDSGFPIFVYCRYLSTGTFMVQLECWS